MSILSAALLGASIGCFLVNMAPLLERWATALTEFPPMRPVVVAFDWLIVGMVAVWQFIRFDLPDAIRRR